MAPPNPRIQRLRVIASQMPAAPQDFDPDDEPTRPGIEAPPGVGDIPGRARAPMTSVADGVDARAATFFERVLGTIPPAWRFASLVAILATALAAFYLYKTLP